MPSPNQFMKVKSIQRFASWCQNFPSGHDFSVQLFRSTGDTTLCSLTALFSDRADFGEFAVAVDPNSLSHPEKTPRLATIRMNANARFFIRKPPAGLEHYAKQEIITLFNTKVKRNTKEKARV
jgi:hypothetical protein